MSDIITNKFNQNESTASCPGTGRHLKLVASLSGLAGQDNAVNPSCVKAHTGSFQKHHNPTGFSALIQQKALYRYTMDITDSIHSLTGRLVLKIHCADHELETTTVSCQFPSFDTQCLNLLIENDETLYGAIMISFQLKVLEQLLLFCGEHDANTLHILVSEAEAPELEIYHNFSVLKETVLTPQGHKVKIVVPADSESYDHLVDFTTQTCQEFNKSLWHDQASNWAIRRYLKTHPPLSLS
jgi:hypothetical protein